MVLLDHHEDVAERQRRSRRGRRSRRRRGSRSRSAVLNVKIYSVGADQRTGPAIGIDRNNMAAVAYSGRIPTVSIRRGRSDVFAIDVEVDPADGRCYLRHDGYRAGHRRAGRG